jgi:hypothetical protein
LRFANTGSQARRFTFELGFTDYSKTGARAQDPRIDDWLGLVFNSLRLITHAKASNDRKRRLMLSCSACDSRLG